MSNQLKPSILLILNTCLIYLLSPNVSGQHCTVKNPVEVFDTSDAPSSFSLEGYTWEMPWGYNKPENADRNYPLVIFTLRHEASQFFTTQIRQQYPAFYVTADCSTDAQTSEFATAVNALIDTHNYRIDINRIYVTGFSWGGACTFKFVRAFLKRGQPVAAVSRIAGDSETKYIPESVKRTAFWLHVGLEDTQTRIQTIRSIYDSIKAHPYNADATETIISDELNYSGTLVQRTTKVLSKNGDDIFKCSEYSQGHAAFAFYKDPGFFKWLFERMVCDITPPTRPININATASSSSMISLNWTASEDNIGVTGYNVYRNGSIVAKAATCSCNDGGLDQYTLYSYSIEAFDSVGNISEKSEDITVRTLSRHPINIQITYPSTTEAQVTWQPDPFDTNIKSFRLQVNGETSYYTSDTVYNFTGRTPGSGNLIRLCSVHNDDVCGEWSAYYPMTPPTTMKQRTLYVDQNLTVAILDGTYDVSPTDSLPAGNAYPSIRAALIDMNKGDIIILREGVYTGRVVLPNLKNGDSWEQGHYNTLMSYPGEWAVLDGQNNLRGDDGQGSSSWLATLGYSGILSYWKFERLEICNGRNPEATVNSGCSRGFHSDGGPFIFRYCYIHDNNCDYVGNIPAGLSGHSWHDCIVEYCYFKDNGSLTSYHWNASHITMFSDYNSQNIARNDYSGENGTRRNIFRYNLFEGGSGGMFETKSIQFFSGRNVGINGYEDTFKKYGDNVHHNIFKNLGCQAIECEQDFIQIHNNIISNCQSGLLFNAANGFGSNIYKTVTYNNTLQNTQGSAINAKQWNGFTDPLFEIEPMLYGYVYNNILDNCTYYDTWNKEEITLSVYGEDFLQDEYKIDRCYSYRPHSHYNDPIGEKMICWKDKNTRYTINEFKSFRPEIKLWMNSYDTSNQLYQDTSGAAQFKTRGAHILSDRVTIANAGIGGPHPYLEGVSLPSYIGATNPSDNKWVDGVLSLANKSSLQHSLPGDPDWIEGRNTIAGIIININTLKEQYLSQNYPNPFASSTTICFNVKEAGHYNLKILDITGREIAVLFDGHAPAGINKIEWDGTNTAGQKLSNGIYLYQLKSGSGFMETKKLFLMK